MHTCIYVHMMLTHVYLHQLIWKQFNFEKCHESIEDILPAILPKALLYGFLLCVFKHIIMRVQTLYGSSRAERGLD